MAERSAIDDKSIAAHLDAAIAVGDVSLVVRRLRDVARARGLPELVQDLTDTPTFESIVRVISGLDLRLGVHRSSMKRYSIEELLAGCDFSIP